MSAASITILRAENPGRLERAVVLGRRPDGRTFAVWHEDADGRATDAKDYATAIKALKAFLLACKAAQVAPDMDSVDPLLGFVLRLVTEIVTAKESTDA